ncbi:SDR family NAD(P)-dependent oxidoreductase [Rickettsiales bacterium LUAb2]
MQKVVVITGGSLGIGAACASKFQQNNYKIVNLDIVKPESSQGLFIETDLTKRDLIKQAFTKIKNEFGKVDILVANAGIHFSCKLDEVSDADYDKVIATNLTATFSVIQETIKLMKENGGRIVTVGSDQSFIAKSNSAVYGLTKAAISHLTKSIALDYSKYGITANCVAPGTIDTPLYRNAMEKYCKSANVDMAAAHIEEANAQPVKRIATPQEVADFIYYLSTEASSFIQGATLSIDGGYTIR